MEFAASSRFSHRRRLSAEVSMRDDSLDRVAAEHRFVIDQTLAAERLEGWRPDGDNVADLVALLGGRLTFGEYLTKHLIALRGTPAVPVRRRVFRRHRPYLLPGTTVLRNNFGLESQQALAELEFVATAGRIAQWHRRIAAGTVGRDDVDFGVTHQHVFADVYGWAGRYRVTELRRGDVLFAWQSEVAPAMQRVGWAARRLAATGAELDDGPLAYRFARLYAEYNRVHPFREGNGRTGTLVLHTVAALCGRRLDLGAFNRDEWIDASRDSMPPRRDRRASHRPFLPLFLRALRQEE
jgi:cell filamentation protein